MSHYPSDVWKKFDSEELNRQYSPSQFSVRFGPDDVIESHVKTVTEAYDRVIATIPGKLNVIYGPSDRQTMDIFKLPSAPDDSPIFAFIHGGYWQQLSKVQASICVEALVKANVTVALVGYDLAPKATMDDMVHQVQMAAKYIVDMAKKNNSKGVHFAGHSAGGHLAAMIPTSDWLKNDRTAIELIKGYVCISGVFDLRPLIRTYVNDPIHMAEDVANRNSPASMTKEIATASSKDCRLVIAVGQNDSPEFRRQSKEFYEDLRNAGATTEYISVPTVDHFDIIEKLADEKYTLTQVLLRMTNDHLH